MYIVQVIYLSYYLNSSATSLVVASNAIFLTRSLLEIGSPTFDVFLAVAIVSFVFSARLERFGEIQS